MRSVSFIIQVLKPFKLSIAGMLLVCLLFSIDISLRPYLLKILLNKLVAGNNPQAVSGLIFPAVAYVGMSLFMTLVFRCYDIIWLKFNPPLKRHIGLILLRITMQHSNAFFHNNFAGNIGNKIKDVMSGIPDLIKIYINDICSIAISVTIAIYTLAQVNYKFSVALFVWITVFSIGAVLFAKRAKQLSHAAAEVKSLVVGNLVDIMSNIINIRLFTSAKFEEDNLKLSLNKYVNADQARDWYFLKIFAFQGLSFAAYNAVCMFLLLRGIKEGQITPGDFALIATINVGIINNLWNLSQKIGQIAEISGTITQGLNLLLAPPEITDVADAKELLVSRGQIVFDKVDFHYTGITPLFSNKSVTIAAKSKVGLVGYSGSGKSTFVNLILRLYEIKSGNISIDGQDIKTVTQESLRRSIAIIPQDPSLFHRSLMENIRYGKIDASEAEVVAAAKAAKVDDFITKIPAGYSALVGERGVKLSGGQRQRIAIARAILKNSPILILDEATSQLDSVTEKDIWQPLLQLMENRTTLVIAHRLSTLLHMDRILVFDQGRVVEDGTHAELLGNNGLYRRMWDAQVGGFLPDKPELSSFCNL